MAKKQQIILLHGSKNFTDKSLLVKGEVAIEHGATASEVKIHTLDNNDEIATFASQAYIDNQVDGVSKRVQANTSAIETLNGSVDTAGSVAKAVNDAKSELSNKIDTNVNTLNGSIDKVSQDLATAIADYTEKIGTVSGDLADEVSALEKSIENNLKTAKDYTDELRNNAVANNTKAITANTKSIETIQSDYLKSADKTELSNAITAETSAREAAISAETSARETAINGINTKIGTVAEDTNLAKMIADETSARQTAISGETSARTQAINALQSQIDNLNDTYATDTELANEVAALETKISNAQTAATTKVVEGDENEHLVITESTGTTGNTYTISLTDVASASALTALDGTVSILIGTDANKSAREIATDEANKAVTNVINGAPEAFDTLKEIADWIGTGEDISGVTAADMLVSINKNKTDIANEITARTQADNALQSQIDGIKNDYLKSTDKTELNNAITAETSARETAINGINTKIGTVAEGTNLAKMIADETSARTQSINAVQSQIDNLNDTYATDTELANEVAALEAKINNAQTAATTKVVEGTDAGNNLSITESTGTTGNTYTINLTDVASASALTALDGSVSDIASNYVKSVKVVSNNTTHTYTPVNNVLDLSGMVIDGGTY